jgi:hypothetical protein
MEDTNRIDSQELQLTTHWDADEHELHVHAEGHVNKFGFAMACAQILNTDVNKINLDYIIHGWRSSWNLETQSLDPDSTWSTQEKPPEDVECAPVTFTTIGMNLQAIIHTGDREAMMRDIMRELIYSMLHDAMFGAGPSNPAQPND